MNERKTLIGKWLSHTERNKGTVIGICVEENFNRQTLTIAIGPEKKPLTKPADEFVEIEFDKSNYDPLIRPIIETLQEAGIETFESCQSGPGHSFPEPTVRFHGDSSEGFRAFAWAKQHGLKVNALRRYYQIEDGWPAGPEWEMTFILPETEGA